MTPPPPRDKDRYVSFRLGRPYSENLEEVARANGLSPGQFARLVLVMHFEQTALHRLADELEGLKKEVTELRAEFGIATFRAPTLGLVEKD